MAENAARPSIATTGVPSLGRRMATALYRRPTLALALLLAAPMLWLGVVYLGSLFALLIQSFYHLDGFTGQVVRQFTLATYRDLITRVNIDIAVRTVSCLLYTSPSPRDS